MEVLRRCVGELYEVRDTVFGPGKRARLRSLVSAAEQAHAALPAADQQGARGSFLLGKALDALDVHDPRAEQLLASSVKLDNTDAEAWCALGHCFWKGGQTAQAADCFRNGADVVGGGGGAVANVGVLGCLHNLGQLLRSLGSTPQEIVDNSRASVALCKRALKLDFCNAQSWYLLGNALLNSFYVDRHQPGRDDTLPGKILAAFANAERHGQADRNPDLCFNRGKFHKYHRQNFPAALRDFATAVAIDPDLRDAADEAGAVRRRFRSVAALLAKPGAGIKPKRFAAARKQLRAQAASFRAEVAKSARKDFFTSTATRGPAALGELAMGMNPGTYVHLTMLVALAGADDPPATWLVADAAGTVAALVVYDAAETPFNRVTAKSHILVVEPELVHVRVEEEEKTQEEEKEKEDVGDVQTTVGEEEASGQSEEGATAAGGGGNGRPPKRATEQPRRHAAAPGASFYPALHVRDGRRIYVDGKLVFDVRQVQMQNVSQARAT